MFRTSGNTSRNWRNGTIICNGSNKPQRKPWRHSSRDGITLTRPDRTIIRVVCPIAGYTPYGLCGTCIDRIVHPGDVEGLRRSYRHPLENRARLAPFQLRIFRADGSPMWIEGTMTDMIDDASVQAFVLNYRDITMLKRHELAMLEFGALVENTSLAIFAKDLDGIVLSWNPGAEFIFGYSAGEIIGAHVRKMAPNELQDEERQLRSIVLETRKALPQRQTVRLRKDGTRLTIGLVLAPLLANGEVRGIAQLSYAGTAG